MHCDTSLQERRHPTRNSERAERVPLRTLEASPLLHRVCGSVCDKTCWLASLPEKRRLVSLPHTYRRLTRLEDYGNLTCIVFDTEIMLAGAGSLSFCMCRWRRASFKEE